jgi:NAD(P)-dependent dehydrogenase (short-subunit alcohol dehydrogenase family)
MPSVLITGASCGLGKEFVSQYADAGWRVFAAARNAGGRGAGVPLTLDVENATSVQSAAQTVGEPLDCLILNAGIYGPKPGGLGGIDYGAWEDVFRVNVLGAMRVAEAFLPHIERGGRKVIAAISSQMGSIAGTGGAAYAYRSSKAALNMVVATLAVDLKAKGITVIALHPGWVRTDMGGASAPLVAERSVKDLRTVIERASIADSGRFFNHDGSPLPW